MTSVYRSGVSRSLHQGEVADVAEIDRQQLRRHPLRHLRQLRLEPVPRREHHLLDAVDRQVVVRRQLAASSLVEAGENGSSPSRKIRVLGSTAMRPDRREERLGSSGASSCRCVRVPDPRPIQQRADEEDRFVLAVPARAAGPPSQAIRSACCPGVGRGIAGRTAAANASGLTLFRAYGSGKMAVIRLELAASPGR